MHKNLKAPLGLAAAILTLSGCSQLDQVQNLSDLSHIHSVATDGENIYVGSHHGLYVWKQNEWKLEGDDFDVMGLAISDGIFYSSGHPGPTQDLPDPVGVLISTNQGKMWKPLSLTGEVDFHLLEASGDNLIGVASNIGSVLKSSDGGTNWENVQIPLFVDVAINPNSPNEILTVSESGLSYSNDFASTFSNVSSITNVVKIDWNTDYVFASTTNSLFRSVSPNETFEEINYEFESIADINAEKSTVVVLDKLGVHVSYDSGNSFSLVASSN